MLCNRDTICARIKASEGGYAEKPTEPGGAVNMGITMATFRTVHPLATFYDLKMLTDEEAFQIYESHYMLPVHYDWLPSGVDYIASDWAINHGLASFLLGARQVFNLPANPVVYHVEPQLITVLINNQSSDTFAKLMDARWAMVKTWPDFAAKAAGRAFRMNTVFWGANTIAGLVNVGPRYSP